MHTKRFNTCFLGAVPCGCNSTSTIYNISTRQGLFFSEKLHKTIIKKKKKFLN